MDDNKTDNFDANTHPDPLMEKEKTAQEVGGESPSGKMWAEWTAPKPLEGTGLKEHTKPTLTDQQKSDLRAPVSDFRAKLENAARAKTPKIEIGKFDD